MSAGLQLAAKTRRIRDRLPRPVARLVAGRPRPGDLVVLPASAEWAVEWAVLACDPAPSDRLLAVPADSQPMVGSADVAIPVSTSAGPLVLRCAFGGWFDASDFAAGWKVGTLSREDVARAMAKRAAAERGASEGTVLEQEIDGDLEYLDWIREALEPACKVLDERSPAAPDERRAGDGRSRSGSRKGRRAAVQQRLPALAAAVVLSLAAALFWFQHRALVGLRQRGELAVREHQQAVEGLSAAHQERIRRLRQRHAGDREALEGRLEHARRSLDEALRQRALENPRAIFLERFDPRGGGGPTVLRLVPDASHYLLFIPLANPRPGRRYRTELVSDPTGEPLWTDDGLRADEGEVIVVLPVPVLSPGDSVLRLLVEREPGEASGLDLLAEFPLRAVRD